MNKMKIAIVTFSPTGGTQKCATELANSMGKTIQNIDLTDRSLANSTISDEAEITIIAVPSYGGRVPSLADERMKKINGEGKYAVLMTVYGNRAFEDTLIELADIAKQQNFKVVAAVAAIAEHCMDGKIATGRPDAEDLYTLHDFSKKIAEKISSSNYTEPEIPGNRPYKKPGPGMQPQTYNTCNACGQCARQCPVGAISVDDCKKIDKKKCIGCMRCVANCPLKAKRLSGFNRFLTHTFLSITAGKRKELQLFI